MGSEPFETYDPSRDPNASFVAAVVSTVNANARPARTSVYHCGACERETDVDGSTLASGPCPSTGNLHAVDLAFHHRHAHNPLDEYARDPDCEFCQSVPLP
jgi:hypothetical protein